MSILKYPEGWKPRPDKYGHQQRLGSKWRGTHTLIKYSTWITGPIIVLGIAASAPILLAIQKWGPRRWVEEVDCRSANEINKENGRVQS